MYNSAVEAHALAYVLRGGPDNTIVWSVGQKQTNKQTNKQTKRDSQDRLREQCQALYLGILLTTAACMHRHLFAGIHGMC
jgi:hypothetical protein